VKQLSQRELQQLVDELKA